MKRLSWFVCLCILSFTSASAPAQDKFQDLLRRLPGSANAIMLIDVDELQESPLAKREGWRKRHEEAYVSRPIMLPPESDRIVIGSQIDAAGEMRTVWDLALISMVTPMSMQSIARAEGGYLDEINGLKGAWTPSEAYFVNLDDATLGMMYPADRQRVSRWIDHSRKNRNVLVSDYLQKAAALLKGKTQVAMAIDLKDVVQRHKVGERLEQLDSLKKNERKIAQLTELMPGLLGVTLSIEVDRKAIGRLTIDFNQSAAPFANFAKPMVLEVFNHLGATIDELEEWKFTLQGNSIVATGEFTQSGLRRVFSLLEIPTTKFSSQQTGDTTSAPSPGSPEEKVLVGKKSRIYFKEVSVLVDDLQSQLRKSRDNRAVWMERYGRKIDRLPIITVDEDLLVWGASVATTFREMGLAKRGAGIRTGVRKSAVYGNYQTNFNSTRGYWNGGFYSARPTSSVKSEIRTQERAKAQKVRFESFKQIEDSRAVTRREMTKRYDIEF